MKFRHHMQLVLQPTVRVKSRQKSLKDLFAIHSNQYFGLGIGSTFLIKQFNNGEHESLS